MLCNPIEARSIVMSHRLRLLSFVSVAAYCAGCAINPVTGERELALIAREVGAARPLQAAIRAERLADLLEHPAASG